MTPLGENFYHSFLALTLIGGKLEIGLQSVKCKNVKRKKTTNKRRGLIIIIIIIIILIIIMMIIMIITTINKIFYEEAPITNGAFHGGPQK